MATRFVEFLEFGKVLVVFCLHTHNCVGVLAKFLKNAHLGGCWGRRLISETKRQRQIKKLTLGAGRLDCGNNVTINLHYRAHFRRWAGEARRTERVGHNGLRLLVDTLCPLRVLGKYTTIDL